MKTNKILMQEAREALKGNWTNSVLVVFVYILIIQVAPSLPIIGGLFTIGNLFISGAFLLGLALFFLKVKRGNKADVGELFSGFSNYAKSLGSFLWFSLILIGWALISTVPLLSVALYVASRGNNLFENIPTIESGMNIMQIIEFIKSISWLLVIYIISLIPSIIAQYRYSQIFYILADNQNMKIFDIFKLSKNRMKGKKWKLFCLHLRFLGWNILSVILTFGIGLFWTSAWMFTANTAFYEDVKAEYEADNGFVETPAATLPDTYQD